MFFQDFEASNTVEGKIAGQGTRQLAASPSYTLKKAYAAMKAAKRFSGLHKSLKSLHVLHSWGFNSEWTNDPPLTVHGQIPATTIPILLWCELNGIQKSTYDLFGKKGLCYVIKLNIFKIRFPWIIQVGSQS